MFITRTALTAAVAAAILGITASPARADAPITFASPVFHQATCTAVATIDIPDSPNVIYALDTIPGPAGSYLVELAGPHEVYAFPSNGAAGYAVWDYTTVVPTAAQCAPTPRNWSHRSTRRSHRPLAMYQNR